MSSTDEGNSVDPPALLPPGLRCPAPVGVNYLDGPNEPSAVGQEPHRLASTVSAGGTVVFQSSSSSTSTARIYATGESAARLSSLVKSTDALKTSLSATGELSRTPLLDIRLECPQEVAQTSELTAAEHPSVQHVARQAFDSYSFTKETTNVRVSNCCTKETVSVSLDQSLAVSTSKQFEPELQAQTQQFANHRSQKSEPEFKFETSQLASRIKPQLTSDFLSQEFGCAPEARLDIDSILRKYGIDTSKYNIPLSQSRHGGGDLHSKPSSYSFCRTSSDSPRSSSPYSSQYSQHSTFLPTQKPVNLSQNNEALNTLLKHTETTENETNTHLNQPIKTQQPLQEDTTSRLEGVPTNFDIAGAVVSTEGSENANTGPSTKAENDTSKNNDTAGAQDSHGERGPGAAIETSATHESSVDHAVDVTSENGTETRPETAVTDSPYAALRNAKGLSTYHTVYGGTRPRFGGYSMSSRPSNMDTSPFEGSFLKHHVSSNKYQSLASAGSAINTETTPASSSKDNISSLSSGFGSLGSKIKPPHANLDFSLLQERQRLRNIDNLITSGSARSHRGYMGTSYMPGYYSTSINSPAALSRGSSSLNANAWGNVTPAPGSYDNPNDIATIRRAGSNVDTGQFNNNRAVSDMALYRTNYKPELYKQQNLRQADQTPDKKDTSNNKQRTTANKPTGGQTRPVAHQRAPARAKASTSTGDNRKVGCMKATKDGDRQGGGIAQRNTQMNNSHTPISDGFTFARDVNSMWCQSVWGENSIYARGQESDSRITNRERSSDDDDNGDATDGEKTNSSRKDMKVSCKTAYTAYKANVVVNRGPQPNSKYQPYIPQGSRDGEKQQQKYQVQQQKEGVEEAECTTSSFSKSKNQEALQAVAKSLIQQHKASTAASCCTVLQRPHQTQAGVSAMQDRPSQRQPRPTRALATHLIATRQQRLQNTSAVQPNSTQQKNTKKRAKPTRLGVTEQGRSSQVNRSTVRPVSTRSTPMITISTKSGKEGTRPKSAKSAFSDL